MKRIYDTTYDMVPVCATWVEDRIENIIDENDKGFVNKLKEITSNQKEYEILVKATITDVLDDRELWEKIDELLDFHLYANIQVVRR